MEDDFFFFFFFFFLTGPIACCSVLRVNAPVQPRRPSTLTLVLIRRWTHLIPPLTPHSPFVPATSCPDPNIDPQVDQAYFAPHPPRLPPMVLTMIYPKQAYFMASEDIKQKQNERTSGQGVSGGRGPVNGPAPVRLSFQILLAGRLG